MPLSEVRGGIPRVSTAQVHAREAARAIGVRERGLRQPARLEPREPRRRHAGDVRPGHPGVDRFPLPDDGRRAEANGLLCEIAQPGSGHRNQLRRHHGGQPRMAQRHRPRPITAADPGDLERRGEHARPAQRRATDHEDPQLQAGPGVSEHRADVQPSRSASDVRGAGVRPDDRFHRRRRGAAKRRQGRRAGDRPRGRPLHRFLPQSPRLVRRHARCRRRGGVAVLPVAHL